VRKARRDADLSLVEVSQRSGGQISDGHVSRIENGFVRNVKPNKLRALARGLGMSEAVLAAAAMGHALSEPDALEQRLLETYRRLPKGYQEDLMRISSMLEREHGIRPAEEIGSAKARRSSPRAA